MTLEFIALAFQVSLSSTYGYQEWNCGDIGKPKPCDFGAITASGEVFDPELPTAAVFMPTNIVMRPVNVWMQVEDGPCVKVRVNDKGNPRYIGERAFDLSPRSLELLIGYRSPTWSGRVTTCTGENE